MSTLPTSDEMSWLLSSPGSVLVIADLAQHRRLDAHHAEAREIAAEFFEPLDGPWRHDAVEIATGNAVVRLQHRAEALRREETERRLVDGRTLDCVDGMLLHHRLQALGDRRLAAADGTQQIENLLALFESLGSMLEEGDDLLDRLFHAEELAEGRVTPDDAVAEDPGQARVVARVDLFRFTDAREHPFRGGRIRSRRALAQLEVILEAHFLVLRGRVIRPEIVEQRRHRRVPNKPNTKMPDIRVRFAPAPGIRSGTASWSCCLLLTPRSCLRQPQKRRGHGGRIRRCFSPIQKTPRALYCITRARHGGVAPRRGRPIRREAAMTGAVTAAG